MLATLSLFEGEGQSSRTNFAATLALARRALIVTQILDQRVEPARR